MEGDTTAGKRDEGEEEVEEDGVGAAILLFDEIACTEVLDWETDAEADKGADAETDVGADTGEEVEVDVEVDVTIGVGAGVDPDAAADASSALADICGGWSNKLSPVCTCPALSNALQTHSSTAFRTNRGIR